MLEFIIVPFEYSSLSVCLFGVTASEHKPGAWPSGERVGLRIPSLGFESSWRHRSWTTPLSKVYQLVANVVVCFKIYINENWHKHQGETKDRRIPFCYVL